MLVLASASPRRSALLREAGVEFRVVASGVDETDPEVEGESPATRAERVAAVHARAKARAVADTLGNEPALVLGADTVVAAADGSLLGKPNHREESESHLRALSGTTHGVTTAVCLLDHPSGETEEFTVTTAVTMRALAEDEIRAYVDSGEGLDKAGGYAIQENADTFVTALEGSRTNVVGLPVDEVLERLRRRGMAS